MSSNVGQSYPYSSETEDQRAAAIATALERDGSLADKLAAEVTPLGEPSPAQNGAPQRWWTWVCPKDVTGRLHVAGYARERYGLFTVCDSCGSTFLR